MELFSTEFYVIVFTVAALVIGFLVKPASRGLAETSFAEGMLTADAPDADPTPRIEVQCLSNGDVAISRCGLTDLTSSATVALAITHIGFDLTVEERVTPGHYADSPVNRATFIIKGLAPERYHIKYNSPSYSIFLATTLPNRPGIAFTRNFPA